MAGASGPGQDVISRVRKGDWHSEEFVVGVGVHQGFVSQPATLYHCVRCSIHGVPYRLSMGAGVRRRPDD